MTREARWLLMLTGAASLPRLVGFDCMGPGPCYYCPRQRGTPHLPDIIKDGHICTSTSTSIGTSTSNTIYNCMLYSIPIIHNYIQLHIRYYPRFFCFALVRPGLCYCYSRQRGTPHMHGIVKDDHIYTNTSTSISTSTNNTIYMVVCYTVQAWPLFLLLQLV